MSRYKTLIDSVALFPDPDPSSAPEGFATPTDTLTLLQVLGPWAKITAKDRNGGARSGWVKREALTEVPDNFRQVKLFDEPFGADATLVEGRLETLLTVENWEKVRIETDKGQVRTGWIENEADDATESAPSAVPDTARLVLGKNEDYRDALLKAEKITGIDAAALAALIDAEAAPIKAGSSKGQWDRNSQNDASGAAGLTQFLESTWLDHAKNPNTLLNRVGKQKGYLTQANAVVSSTREDLLALRFDPELSIVSAAEFGIQNLKALEDAGVLPDGLSDDEKARYIYLAHHEGGSGAIKFLKNDNSASRDKLVTQVGSEKAKALIAEAGGDVALAYRNWLNGYMNQKIRPSKFRGPASPSPAIRIPAAAHSGSAASDVRYVTTEGLNLRASPNGAVLKELTMGDPVRVLGNADEPKWLNVDASGTKGVIFSDYLRQPIAPAKEALLKSAVDQWVRFQKGKANEAADPFCTYVEEMWRSIGLNYDGRSRYPNGEEVPWSAAFISYVVRNAGPSYANFRFDASHSTFSHDAIQARVLGRMNKPFWGYRISEMKPELGDIIHRSRGKGNVSFDYAESHSSFVSHSDIVVEVREKVVRVLGGNVSDTVSMSSLSGSDDLQEYSLDEAGYLAPGQRVIALLKNRADELGT